VWAIRGSLDCSALEAAGADRCLQGCEASELAEAIAGLIKSLRHPRAEGDPAPVTLDLDTAALRHIRAISADDPPDSSLSGRQEQIRELVTLGLTDKEIARHLGISYYTVRAHLRLMLQKFGVHRRSQLPPPMTAPQYSC
jgi:DNA-binding NarL/FixJ family response regulator